MTALVTELSTIDWRSVAAQLDTTFETEAAVHRCVDANEWHIWSHLGP